MEEDIKVSIIIPVYNGAEFLEQTMSCVINQTYDKIEVICIDDASTDNSIDILERLKKEDNRITIIRQSQHTNAGETRNQGLHVAKGKYLLFWDADDLMELHAVESLVQKMEEDNADICVCNADQYDTERDQFIKKDQYLQLNKIKESIPFSIESNPQYIFNFTVNVPWNKMFRRDFVNENHIEFQSIPRANDQYFVMNCLALAKRITILNDVLIHYRINQKNNLTTQISKTPICTYEALITTKERLEALQIFSDNRVLQSFSNRCINALIYSLNIQTNTQSYCQLYEFYKEEGFNKLGIKDYGEEYFYNILEYKIYKLMQENSYDTYLLLKNSEYRDTIARKNHRINDLVKEKKQIQAEFKKVNKEIRNIKDSRGYKLLEKMRKLIKIFRKG